MIRIVTDSASDITQDEAKKLNIDVIPLTTRFKDKEYLDGIDIDNETFYELLTESGIFPTTSCASPGQFMEIFEKYPDDEIIYIAVSSKLSGCYQSALIAKENNENIYLVDSKHVSPSQRILILEALSLVEKGLSAKEVVSIISEEANKLKVIAAVDTLEYLKRGGRISPAVAMVGGMLSIKPIVEMKDGEIAILGKARGTKNVFRNLNESIIKNGGIDFSKPVCLAYSGSDDKVVTKYAEDNECLNDGSNRIIPISTIGSTIGTHVGPGAIAVAYFTK